MARSPGKKAVQGRPSAPAREAGRLSAHRPVFERLLFALALLGVLTTVHLIIQQGRGFDRGCLGFSDPGTVSATFDCEAVTQSSAGQLFGVSNGVWGLIFYVVVVGVCGLIALGSAERRLWWKRVRAGLLGMGLLYSFYLSYVQYVVLEELCALCLTSAVIVLLLCLVQTLYLFQPLEPEKPSMKPSTFLRDGAVYGALAVLLLVLAAADVVYFNTLPGPGRAVAAAQATLPVNDAEPGAPEAACNFDDQRPPVQDFDALIAPTDPVEGNPRASVTFVEFFDPNCPHCKHLHPIMTAVLAQYGDSIRVVYKPIALPGWDYSIPQVAALLAASDAGKFPAMLEQQFARQQRGGLSMDQLKEIAREIGMDANAMARRIEQGDYQDRMTRTFEQARAVGVRGVPTVIFNGRIVASGSRSEGCFGEFIEAALRQDQKEG